MRRLLRHLFIAAGFMLAAAPVAATVPPLTPEGRVMMERQNGLENAVRARFGDAMYNRLRDGFASVVVAEESRGGVTAPRVLIKDESGWQKIVERGQRPVSRRVAAELDRLMVPDALWNERPYVASTDCRATTQLFILRYAGREQFGRQPCGSFGLAGRAADVAATLRIPSSSTPGTAGDPFSPAPAEAVTRTVGSRAQDMVWAWERRSLAGAVDPYAQDVVVELPGRTLHGKDQLVDWLRPQQDWSRPEPGIKLTYERGTMFPPKGDYMTEMREVRWEAAGKPLRRTYSATWAYRDGLWKIVHERVSADKPVTGDRQIW